MCTSIRFIIWVNEKQIKKVKFNLQNLQQNLYSSDLLFSQ